ncbi:DNA replication complex GINS family protein [Methanococcus aeolicus]|uniref:DNA replication complex GINS family protein n=1 Tax=Methanococcus aeolicus (strain ATCC BAA-1280 / DSM 17508 / OCM 812 / Nankai-3) TaxID=419665 RepID=A6UUW1_META3|nr:hypothetical protein [Methanococcus aeolicus]ABR56283.1 conserved hypothetical protein [Methanococcus aeolicus Nankai-3]UXM84293.1 DNA replication complex GINS family protein [Methanococcus aeolicus]
MYNKIKNTFFNELNSDSLLKLSDDFYDDIRSYLNSIANSENHKMEYKRALNYSSKLRKLRIYKALFEKNFPNEDMGAPSNILQNLTKEEEIILKLIDNIEYINSYNDDTPKPINTQTDIDIVRVNTGFPEFTDGKRNYNLNKNDVITLDKKISSILEKHDIVKKISSGE